MYVAVTGKGRARVIQFCEQHRIPGTTKKKTTIIKTIGNYENMLEKNPNIIPELKEEAKHLTLLQKENKKIEKISCQIQNNSLFRFGHVLVKEMWKQLELEDFLILHFGKEEGKEVSKHLFSLVVYRLGSSYKNFRSNRKIPFLNLSTLSEEVFYTSLEKIAGLQESLCEHLDHFFARNTDRAKHPIYCHISSYHYHAYWKSLQKKDRENSESKNHPFSMLLAFDTYGIPSFFSLIQENEAFDKFLEEWQEKKKSQTFISLSKEFIHPRFPYFLNSSSLGELAEEIQKKILEEPRWHILEKDAKTEEILKKEMSFPWKENTRFYIHWSRKRAFKDYSLNNQRQGYFCLHTNDAELETTDMLNIYQHIWKIEEKFSISDVTFQKKHIQGHFTLCFLCLCIIRYFQYLLGAEGNISIPMIYANKAISNPMVLRQGIEALAKIHPLHITNSYLKLAKILKLPPLQNSMGQKEFEQNTTLHFES